MLEIVSYIVSLLTALGFGGVVGAYFQHKFQHKRNLKEDVHNLKRKRYGAILIQMLTLLDPENNLSKTKRLRPDLENSQDLMNELKTETLNGILFASDDVINSMAGFVSDPTYENFVQVASAMRNDLWDTNTNIDTEILEKFKIDSQ